MTALRHYQVESPERTTWSSSHVLGLDGPETSACWGVFLACDASDAKVKAVRDRKFASWVDEMRSDDSPPFKGLRARLARCEHGACWACSVCDACVALGQEDDQEDVA